MKMRTTFFTDAEYRRALERVWRWKYERNGRISGTIVKGPVRGATVAAFVISNGTMGAQVGGGTTDSAGNFIMSVGDYTGPLMLQTSGGTYIDEATGTTMTMQPGDVMLACVPAVATGDTTTGLQVTPLTSMACARAKIMTGGLTTANMTTANTALGTYFSVSDVLHTMPMDPTIPGSASGATQDAKNYGMVVAAMSQYARTIGMTTSSSGIVTAMMNDASDGTMNGMMGSTAINMAGMGGMSGGGMMGGSPTMQSNAGTSGLSTAMSGFVGSTMNRSGVSATDIQALVNKLMTSSGNLQ